MPLFTEPNTIFCKNNKSALLESDFLCEALNDLIDRCLIGKCSEAPFVVIPLTVAVHGNGRNV